MIHQDSLPGLIEPVTDPGESAERGWFLKDSSWNDLTWILAPTNVLEEERPRRIRWDFLLPSARRFSDSRYAELLQSARELLAMIRTRALLSGLPQRGSTVDFYFQKMRELIRWMDKEGISRFVDLDPDAVRQFQLDMAKRKGRGGKGTISLATIQQYLKVLEYLYHFRAELSAGLSFDPLLEQANGGERRRTFAPCTPDEVAVPLIQGAIDLLEASAIAILRARELYVNTMADVDPKPDSYAFQVQRVRVLQELKRLTITTPRGVQTISSTQDLGDLVEQLYTACFVVISYLVGPRASELLHLQTGCVQRRAVPDSASESVVIAGSIFKREPGYDGRAHDWVVIDAAVHAISVLEALSAPHRLRSGRQELWLRGRGKAQIIGVNEWLRKSKTTFTFPTASCMTLRLNEFARWLGVPDHNGQPWHLTTHQGRKTFVHFAALRDRSAIFALAQHLGHQDVEITDRHYVGTDYALYSEIEAEVLDQSVSAWEHMLSVPELGGRAGLEILAKRPQFGGVRMKEDIKAYARMLVEAGLVLGVCDWGFCVYRQEYSACKGNAAGPNPVNREPSTCARCKNFALSAQHRPYWTGQLTRNEALLNDPRLPTQTLKIARQRLEEARGMVRSIDTCTNRTKL